MRVCIVGLGYIGLPTAITFATHGVKVLGVDVRKDVVDALKKGEALIEEPEIKPRLAKALKTGNLTASTKPSGCDVYIICVPTPLTEEKGAALEYVVSAGESLVPAIKKRDLVVLESTVPPGTTADLLAPILAKSGLDVLKDIDVAFCPERVLPGQIFHELVNNDRVVGGMTPRAAERAKKLYSSFVKGTIYTTDATTAEFVKLAENTFRDVNIALANEFARMSSECGIDAWEMITLANRHPRVNIHRPGPGVGGHCIAVDPWYLVEKFGTTAKLVATARRINDSMPDDVVAQVAKMTPKGGRIALLGLAFKGNIDDARESPSLVILDKLKKKGYKVAYSDPFVRMKGNEPMEKSMKGADTVLILTDHDQYRKLKPAQVAKLARRKVVFDTRNVLDRKAFRKAGFELAVIGDGKR